MQLVSTDGLTDAQIREYKAATNEATLKSYLNVQKTDITSGASIYESASAETIRQYFAKNNSESGNGENNRNDQFETAVEHAAASASKESWNTFSDEEAITPVSHESWYNANKNSSTIAAGNNELNEAEDPDKVKPYLVLNGPLPADSNPERGLILSFQKEDSFADSISILPGIGPVMSFILAGRNSAALNTEGTDTAEMAAKATIAGGLEFYTLGGASVSNKFVETGMEAASAYLGGETALGASQHNYMATEIGWNNMQKGKGNDDPRFIKNMFKLYDEKYGTDYMKTTKEWTGEFNSANIGSLNFIGPNAAEEMNTMIQQAKSMK